MKKQKSQNLILYGYKACGKSFFGRLLAKELELNFLDIDNLVESLFNQDYPEKYTCREISSKFGLEFFRQLESRVVDQIHDVKDSIISLGGGTLLNSENHSKLKKIGKLIYLDAVKEKIKQRIFKRGVPSFLNPNDPENSFEEMYRTRMLHYENASPYHVQLKGKSREQILDALKSHYF